MDLVPCLHALGMKYCNKGIKLKKGASSQLLQWNTDVFPVLILFRFHIKVSYIITKHNFLQQTWKCVEYYNSLKAH